MAVSSFQLLRDKVRRAIRDTYGAIWDDTALDAIIFEAQREYSLLAGSNVKHISITATSDNVFNAPDDFIAPVKFIGSDNIEKPFFSWKRLHEDFPDFRKVTGNDLVGVIVDFDGYGKSRLFPKIPAGNVAGTFYYKSIVSAEKLDAINLEAIEQHCLYQVFLLDAKSSAATYYNNFLTAVAKEKSLQRSLRHRSNVRYGRFF